MDTIKKTLKTLPHEPGVYQFHNTNDAIIYVGKALDLSKRVKQYFQSPDALGLKTPQLVAEIAKIQVTPTVSEFDALLLEARLVRAYLPKYNSALRDDKSPLYVVFTFSESLPRVMLVRRSQAQDFDKEKRNRVYGPFQSAQALKSILRDLRHIIPYCTQKIRNGKPCFYTHLGMCGPCPSYIAKLPNEEQQQLKRVYRNNLFLLADLFAGKSQRVIRTFEKYRDEASGKLAFEIAQSMQKKVEMLYHLSQKRYDPAIFLERGALDVYKDELENLRCALSPYYPGLGVLDRIECYDISHLSGQGSVGSMVVLSGGKPDKSQYRRFRIKTVSGISDVAMIAEVVKRRIMHAEWPMPDFMFIDGGKGQVSSAQKVLAEANYHIPIAGLAKRYEEIIVPTESGFSTLRLSLSGLAIKVAQRIRDEAHRFALSYNRLLRSKAFLEV